MLRTRVGYSGGSKQAPSYHDLGDQTETIEIDFDPTETSYEDLLEHFWSSHNCGFRIGKTQYMNAVFYHNDTQKQLAEKTRKKAAKSIRLREEDVKTGILPATDFTYAEDYHQKYYLRIKYKGLTKDLEAIYPNYLDFANSTVVTRLNALAAERSKDEARRLLKDLPGFGLPEASEAQVRAILVRDFEVE